MLEGQNMKKFGEEVGGNSQRELGKHELNNIIRLIDLLE